MLHKVQMRAQRGFTLIELLVVIAIIGVLSSIALSSLNVARQKAADARRIGDMREIQKALELYATDHNNTYPPITTHADQGWGTGWDSECAAGGGFSATQVISGLAPKYISALPADPAMIAPANLCCHLYYSTGTDYKLLEHNCPSATYSRYPNMLDPARDGGVDLNTIDASGVNAWAWAIYSSPNSASW